MSYDLISGKTSRRDWSCGASDLPKSIHGLIPETYWGPEQMEAKLSSIMSQSKGLFQGKPSREEAIPMLASYMKERKIGPKDVAGGVGAEVGSILLPAKDQTRIFDKVDDLRYDIRQLSTGMTAGLFALAGAMAALAFGKIYKAAKG